MDENRLKQAPQKDSPPSLRSEIIHDIRNPVAAIQGLATLLIKDLEGQPKLQKMANLILEGAQEIDQKLNQLPNLIESTNNF